MSEPLQARSALCDYAPLTLGDADKGFQLQLSEYKLKALVLLHARQPAEIIAQMSLALGLELPQVPHASASDNETSTGSGGLRALWAGPGTWLLLSGKYDAKGIIDRLPPLAERQTVALIDSTHGRTAIRVAGTAMRELISQFCPLDLGDQAFPAGRCAQTQVAHVAATLLIESEREMLVLVPRSFAVSVWEALAQGARQLQAEHELDGCSD